MGRKGGGKGVGIEEGGRRLGWILAANRGREERGGRREGDGGKRWRK